MTDIVAPRVPAGPGAPATALPWLAWFGGLALVVTTGTDPMVLGGAILACLMASVAFGHQRRAWFGASAVVAISLVAIWVAWSLLIHRGDADGLVLWVLPSWNPPSGGSFGGAITLAQLHYGLTRALRAAAIALMIGVLGQRVAGVGWLRAADAVLGRGAALLAPLCCLADARLAQPRGLRIGPGSGLAQLALTARQAALDWTAMSVPDRSRRHGLLGFAVQTVLLLGWAIAVLPGGPLDTGLTAPELTTVWLALAIGVGLAFHVRNLTGLRPAAADLPALLGALALLVAWLLADVAGGPLSDEPTGVPWVTLSALAVMPLAALLGRRSQ